MGRRLFKINCVLLSSFLLLHPFIQRMIWLSKREFHLCIWWWWLNVCCSEFDIFREKLTINDTVTGDKVQDLYSIALLISSDHSINNVDIDKLWVMCIYFEITWILYYWIIFYSFCMTLHFASLVRICWLRLLCLFASFFKRDKILDIVSI
jgi:hypothetical protein